MKYMFASDIHGSLYYCRKMLDAFQQENAQRLVLLGDLLYHGPRNDLPKEYAPKEVIALLNQNKNRIYAVRGNCEAEAVSYTHLDQCSKCNQNTHQHGIWESEKSHCHKEHSSQDHSFNTLSCYKSGKNAVCQ